MAKGDFARLRTWAEANRQTVDVTRPDATTDKKWKIVVQLTEPIKFRAGGSGATVDDAAAPVIEQLQTIGEIFP